MGQTPPTPNGKTSWARLGLTTHPERTSVIWFGPSSPGSTLNSTFSQSSGNICTTCEQLVFHLHINLKTKTCTYSHGIGYSRLTYLCPSHWQALQRHTTTRSPPNIDINNMHWALISACCQSKNLIGVAHSTHIHPLPGCVDVSDVWTFRSPNNDTTSQDRDAWWHLLILDEYLRKRDSTTNTGPRITTTKHGQILFVFVFVFSLVCARTSKLPKNRTRVRFACRICRFPLHPFCYAIGPLHAVMDIVKLFLPTTMVASLHMWRHLLRSLAAPEFIKIRGFVRKLRELQVGSFLSCSIFLPWTR